MEYHDVVTFVFSDIEGSTQLAQTLRTGYPDILKKYREVLRKGIREHNGQEIDTAGDGFFMVFNDPGEALTAVVEAQKTFHLYQWAQEIDLKVRIGIHTGNALPTESGLTGVEVHIASRICDAANGGQVLVSKATKSQLIKEANDEYELENIGNYLFKDFEYPLELFQVKISGLVDNFRKPRVHPADKKIAVLPFSSKQDDQDQEYIGYGIAEEIIHALGKVKGLRVISKSTSFAIKDRSMSIQEIGENLEVQSILSGNIEVMNGNYSISAELVDTKSGLNIWSEKYRTQRIQLLNVQDDIIHRVTKALKFTLQPGQKGAIQHRQTYNAEAYDYYLRGRRFYSKFSTRGIELALQMFQKAVEEDEAYALAYAGKADCYSYQYQHVTRSPEILDLADTSSEMAIKLGPGLAEVYVSRGIVLHLRQQIEESEKSFQFAIEHDPTLFLGWFHYARLCFTTGRLEKAARLFEQANKVEPDDYQSIFLAAQSYDDIGANELADKLRKKGVIIAERWIDLNPGDTRALYLAANALVFLDHKDKSLSFLQQALAIEPNDSMLLYNAACIYSLLNMKEPALNCIEKSFKEGLTLRGWYENDSNLDNIRSEPRFIVLLEKLRKSPMK